jgi:hypothetical protein
VEFRDVLQSIVDEELTDITFPQREGEPTGSAILIGEIQTVVVIANVFGAVPVVDAVVIQ